MAQQDLTAQQLALIADSARIWEVRRFCQVLPSVVQYERGNGTTKGKQPIFEPNGALAALLRCIIYHLGADLAMVSLLDDHTQYFVSGASRSNMRDARATLESARWYGCESTLHHGGLCERTITQHDSPGSLAFYEELDMANTERTKDLPFVRGDLAKFRYYAGVPLSPYDGPNVGTVFMFCARASDASRTDDIRSYLTETAKHITRHLEQAVEALEGQRALRFNRGITSLLGLSHIVEVGNGSESSPQAVQRGRLPLLSDRYSDDVLRLYHLAAKNLCDIFELDGAGIQEAGSSEVGTISNPNWNGSTTMAQYLQAGARPLEVFPASLTSKLLQSFPQGAVYQVATESGVVIAATGSTPAALVDDSMSRDLIEAFSGAEQIVLMPLWDTHHERNTGAILGFAYDRSRAYLGLSDLSSISAFCATVMTQVRRLDVQAMNQIKSDFLGSISHEMRTPLHGILSNLDLLAENPHGKDRRELLEMARFSGASLLDSMDRLLNFSKISSRVKRVDELFSKELNVFTNLLDNALKFGDPAGCIRVRLWIENETAKLSFYDTGKGIAPDYIRHRIFEPFSQENPQNEGTGLGLSLVRQTAIALGGDVLIDSHKTWGSTFTVVFPLHRLVTCLSQEAAGTKNSRLRSDASESPQLDLSLFASGRWVTGDDTRDLRCTDIVSESLKESASPWFRSKIVPWEAEVTLPRLLFAFVEDIDLAIPASGDVLGHSKLVVLCPNKEGVIYQHVAASEDSTAHFGPVTPSSLQDALARLYPDLVPAPDTHGPFSSPSVNANDRETTHNERSGNELATSKTSNSLPGPVGLTLEVPCRNGPNRSPSKLPELIDQQSSGSSSPVQTSNTDVPDRSRIPTQAPSSETSEAARVEPKLLLVDDNSINLKVISMFARKASSKPPTSVSSGREAIDAFGEALANGPYDLIFLDLSMPEMSGFEVAEKIRRIEVNTPHQTRTYICALTALVSAGDRNRAYAAGVDEYVVKPANFGGFKDVINRWRERAQN
ncbi:hypothetical protein N0V86_009856 [Didymella sp. IMI 355093]|nr:hypothetical protein N0V86_009856 [Didymella sp. IMI 355093]